VLGFADATVGTAGRTLNPDGRQGGMQGREVLACDYELTYWSQKFGVSRDRLREAVAKAGPMVKNVERELRG
jgi:hypothetical protein